MLNLKDLLQGENKGSLDSLDNYLHFTQSGADTVVHISSAGALTAVFNPAVVDQTITLTGVNLTSIGNDQAIIQNLLTQGKLVTD